MIRRAAFCATAFLCALGAALPEASAQTFDGLFSASADDASEGLPRILKTAAAEESETQSLVRTATLSDANTAKFRAVSTPDECFCDSCRKPETWYISISGGLAHRGRVQEQSDIRTFIVLNEGFAANAALGFRLGMFRLEAETSFMNNTCKEAGAVGLASGTTGNVNLRALMFNAYRDFQISDWKLKPYVGAGIGIYQSQINSLYPQFFNDVGFTGQPVNTTSNMPFAYQFRAGVSRPITERTEFYAGYRYFHGSTLTFASIPFAAADAPTFKPNGANMHNIEFGLRVNF